MAAAAPGGNHRVHPVRIKYGADAVSVPGEQASEHGYQLRGQHALAYFPGAEVHRAAQVEEKPGGDFAVRVELTYVRRLQPCRNVPVDVADIVVKLVFAQVGEIEAEGAKQRAIVALQQAVEAADDGLFHATQDGVRIVPAAGLSPRRRDDRMQAGRLPCVTIRPRLGHGHRAVCRAPGPPS